MVRPALSTTLENSAPAAPRPAPGSATGPATGPATEHAAVPRDAGHTPAEAASVLAWRTQHLLHPQMLGRCVVMH
jgi:hypothetical protein